MEREEDLISNRGIPLMGGSWISAIHSASVGWNWDKRLPFLLSSRCLHSTLALSGRQLLRETVSVSPTCHDSAEERISVTRSAPASRAADSRWFTSSRQVRLSPLCAWCSGALKLCSRSEFSFLQRESGGNRYRSWDCERMLGFLSVMCGVEQFAVRDGGRERGVFKPHSLAPGAPAAKL